MVSEMGEMGSAIVGSYCCLGVTGRHHGNKRNENNKGNDIVT